MKCLQLCQFTLAVMGCFVAGTVFGQSESKDKTELVGVIGCVNPGGESGTWMLTDATDPVAAVMPADDDSNNFVDTFTAESAASEPLGKMSYRLIGVLEEFSVANHNGHKVLVKGLHISGSDAERINLTSIQHVSPSCSM